MIIEIMSWFLAVYIVLAIVMGALTVITSYKSLKKMKNWQVLVFLILQPILVIREVFNGTNNKSKS